MKLSWQIDKRCLKPEFFRAHVFTVDEDEFQIFFILYAKE